LVQRAKQAAGCAADRHAAQQAPQAIRRRTTAPTPGSASMVTRLAAVAAVAPIGNPDRRALKFAAGRSIAARALLPQRNHIASVPGRHQVSELFEMRLVSDGAMPAASSPMDDPRSRRHMNRKDGR